MFKRWAFAGLTLFFASAVLQCSSSNTKPEVLTTEEDAGTPMPTPTTTPTSTPPSTDAGGPDSTVTDGGTDSTITPPSGPPVAMSLSPNTVNFGAVSCGTTAPSQTVQVINPSTSPVSLGFYFVQNKGAFTAAFVNPVTQQSLGNSVTSLAPSAAVSLVITPVAVPTAPQTADMAGYKDTLQVVVNGGNLTANAIPVQESPAGVVFVFNTTNVQFGDVPVNTTSPAQTIGVTNTGTVAANFNLAISVSGDAGGNPFSVTQQPTSPLAAGPGDSLTVTFNPPTPETWTGTASIVQRDSMPLCAPLPTPVALTGRGVTGNVGIAPTSITFGPEPCGGTAPSQGIYLSNVNGTASYHWAAALSLGSAANFQISPPSGNVAAGAQSGYGQDGGVPTITVTPAAIPQNLATIPDYKAEVDITIDGVSHPVSLDMSASGVIVTASGAALSGTTFAFGNDATGQTATQTLNLNNTGNTTANLNLAATAPFGVQPTVSIPANTVVSIPVTFQPGSAQPYNGTLTINPAPGTTLCNALPGGGTGFTLTGTGVAPVPPSVSLSANNLNFNSIACGATNTLPLSVTVQNTGSTYPFTVAASLQNGASSIFKAQVGSGAVQPGSEATVSVSLPQMPQVASITPDAYADVLQILVTSSINSAVTENIPIHVTASGAIMAFQPTALDFGTVPVNSTTNLPFTVVNSGNLPAEVDLQFNGAGAGDAGSASQFSRTPLGLVDVNGGQSAQITAAFLAADTTPQSGALTMSASNKSSNHFCAPMPSPLTLTGQGSNTTTIVTPTSIDFGLTNCGAQAGQATVTIKNTASTGSVAWSAKFLSGGASYQLSASSGTVNASSSGTFNVIPNSIPTNSAVTPDLYAATLQVTSGANIQTQLIQIHQTAQGVILQTSGNGATNFTALNFGGVSVNQTATAQFAITNNGNFPINNVQLANSNAAFAVNPSAAASDAGAASPQTLTFSLAPQQTLVSDVTFTPSAVQTYNDTATYTFALPTGTVFCGATPPNFTLNGSGNTGIAVSPTNLNFGFVQCNSAPPAGQQITISNKGGATTWSGTFGRGVQNQPSYYSLEDMSGNPIAAGSQQTLPAGTSITVVVVPVKIVPPANTSANAFSDTLTITTGASGDSPHVISITETAQGAFLAFSPLAITGNPPAIGSTGSQTFQISNSGNLAASYYIAVTMTQGNDTSIKYPTNPGACQAYTQSSPYPNQCAPPGSCLTSSNASYSIVLPEFCTNLAYTQGSPGSLFGGQTQNGVIESTGYPEGQFTQAQGYITLFPINTILCSDTVPTIPLSETAFKP